MKNARDMLTRKGVKTVLLFFIFAGAVWFINPFREAALGDSWTNSLAVRNILLTGNYRWPAWDYPNPIFLCYWGTFFSKIFGYSFSTLHISVLMFSFFGIACFYELCKEYRLNKIGHLLTLSFYSSFLFVYVSFYFNTHLIYVSLFIASMLFYLKAFKLKNRLYFFLASIFCSCAILTRQFAIVIPLGLLTTWMLDGGGKRDPSDLWIGLLLPAVAAFYQLIMGLTHPSPLFLYAKARQAGYFSNPLGIVSDVPWRVAAILSYLAMLTAPLVLMILIHEIGTRRKGERRLLNLQSGSAWAILFCGAFMVSALASGYFMKCIPLWMPYLEPTFLVLREKCTLSTQLGLTCFTLIGGAFYSFIFVKRLPSVLDENHERHAKLLGWTSLWALVAQLLFHQLTDQYLIIFLPVALISTGLCFENALIRFRKIITGLCILLLLVSAMWTRGALACLEAGWRGAETLRQRSVKVDEIYGPCEWNCYYKFDDYLEKKGNRMDSLFLFFRDWEREQKSTAVYIVSTDACLPGFRVREVEEIKYRDSLLRERKMYILKKI